MEQELLDVMIAFEQKEEYIANQSEEIKSLKNKIKKLEREKANYEKELNKLNQNKPNSDTKYKKEASELKGKLIKVMRYVDDNCNTQNRLAIRRMIDIREK